MPPLVGLIYLFFSRSRISVSRTSSAEGAGGAGGSAAAASSSFFLPISASLFRPFTRKKTTRARIRKLMMAEMKLP